MPLSRQVRVIVELTWPPTAGDLEERYAGDADCDFAARSFERRVRDELNRLCETGAISGWYAVQRPDFCYSDMAEVSHG